MSSPGNQFNIGKDARMTFLANGQPIGALKVTEFEAKQLTTRLTSKPVNSKPAYREIEEGWEGSFALDRHSPILDDFFAAKEAALYSGAQPPDVAITWRINELNGVTSRYRFDGCALKFDEAGTYKSDDKVMQKVSFVATQRVKV